MIKKIIKKRTGFLIAHGIEIRVFFFLLPSEKPHESHSVVCKGGRQRRSQYTIHVAHVLKFNLETYRYCGYTYNQLFINANFTKFIAFPKVCLTKQNYSIGGMYQLLEINFNFRFCS